MVNRQTFPSINITFPRTMYAGGNKDPFADWYLTREILYPPLVVYSHRTETGSRQVQGVYILHRNKCSHWSETGTETSHCLLLCWPSSLYLSRSESCLVRISHNCRCFGTATNNGTYVTITSNRSNGVGGPRMCPTIQFFCFHAIFKENLLNY